LQIQLKSDFRLGLTVSNTILFADDQVVFSGSGCDLQTAAHQLQIITNRHNLKISAMKTKVMAQLGKTW
jgi:hypothetical protein